MLDFFEHKYKHVMRFGDYQCRIMSKKNGRIFFIAVILIVIINERKIMGE